MYRLENIKFKNIIDIPHLEFPKHKIICLTGQSGTGKTTLLKLLMKMKTPDHGDIYYDELKLSDIKSIEHRRKVLFLPQKAYIFNTTIRENLLLGLRYHQKPCDEDILIQVIQTVKLDKKLDDDASVLSGGEAQRLALARLLILDAETYILDEPSSALDAKSEEIIIDVIASYIKKHQKTLIMVTHNQEIIKKYAEFTIDLNAFKVVTS